MKDPIIDAIVANNIKHPNTIAINAPSDFNTLLSFVLNSKYTIKDI
jgi:hypothetical protein